MDYWKRRDLIERVRLFDLTERDLRRLLQREYLRVYKDVRTRLLDLINSLPANPTANDLYTQDKLYQLLSELQFKLNNLGNFEKSKMEETFIEYYLRNAAQTGVTTNIPIDNARVVKAINNVWAGDGMNFSDRIWRNKRALLNKLQKGLLDTVVTGNNWGTFSKELKKDFGTAFYESRRLVRTELSHIQNESSLEKYRSEGVEEVRYIAEADCCPHCMEHNGKTFLIDRAPIIPQHPSCKCTYIPVINL